MPRPKYECIGPGGAKELPHADGIGSYNAFTIVWEWSEELQLYDAMDYARKGRTHWVLAMIKKLFGIHDDRQLMSLIMEGVRWGIAAPMHMRIAPQLERLDSRIQGVGAAFKKLLDKKLIDVSAHASTCSCNSWQVCDLARPDSGELVLSRMMNG